MKIMFVVHRYVPYEGGSEYFVRDMAEELLRRGHDVTVLCGTHQGSQNGVKVTSNFNLLNQHYDLILVHGSDVTAQNTIHFNSQYINTVSPVVYMIIKPSLSEISKMGLENNKFLSYSSQLDIDFLKDQNKLFKARRIRHGIVPERTIGHFKASNTPIFVSAGGFYPNKAMTELADLYDQSGIAGELHLYGYGMFENAPSESASVKVFKGCAKDEVMAAIKSASAYILNSTEEGYGLVLLEAMMNQTPWFGRADVGAVDELSPYGHPYKDGKDLIEKLKAFNRLNMDVQDKIYAGYDYVMANHTISQTCNDIEDILDETNST